MSSPASPQRLRIFLCHASVDKPRVRELHKQLRTVGVDPWFDEEDLLPGQDWELEIRRVVRDVDVVLVCLSQQAVSQRGFRRKEIVMALDLADEQPEGTIFIIPVKLEACQTPDRLSRWHWVNLFDEQGFQRLLRSLQQRADELGVAITASDTAMPPDTMRPDAMVRDNWVAVLFYKQHGSWSMRLHNARPEQISTLRVQLTPFTPINVQPADTQITELAGNTYSAIYPLTLHRQHVRVNDTIDDERADLEQQIRDVSKRISELRRLFGVAGPIQRDHYRLQIDSQQKILQQHRQDLQKLPSIETPKIVTLRVKVIYTTLDTNDLQAYEDTVNLDLE